MTRKSLPLAVQLALTLVGLVVTTTLVLSVAAYRSFRANLESDARRIVRASAEQTEKTLTRLVEQRQERAQGFLSRVTSLCGESPASGQTSWEVGCAGLALAEFRATERARGALFEYGRRRIAQVGEPPPTDLPLPGSFARIVSGPQGFGYELTAADGATALTVLFSVDDLDVLFRDHGVLGGTGEIFLTDAKGQFLTTPRYLGSATLGSAADVEPVSECLQGPSEVISADYRGVMTLHGVRPVPLFFGGACIDAHLGYDEALAPAETLLSQLTKGGAVFVCLGIILSLIAARWIAAPVKGLALSARALEGGNFGEPIPVSGPSEIRALARGFTNMARAQIRRKHFEDENRRIREELLRAELEATEARAARELAETRAALVEELERKNRELEAFSYSVSHDLRAPLRSIDGFSQALIEDCASTLDPKSADYLRRVRAAAQRMGELIDDLLELSRVGRAELRRTHVDLSNIAQTVVAELRKREPNREVAVEIADGLATDADSRLIRVALENLLGNAWKFTSRATQPQVQFVGERTPEGVVYVVRDNGAGFDMTYAEQLFRPFQRLHGAAEFPGTGIGLATVHRIVDRHGGRVWAEGAVGRGATLYFTIGPSRLEGES